MPSLRAVNHAILAGHQDVVDFTEDDIIRKFPLQADQDLRYRWAAPDLRAANGIPSVRVERSWAGHSRNLGDYFFAWRWAYFTLGMMDYWLDTFLPSNVPSANVTIRTLDRRGNPIYLRCIMHEPAEFMVQEGGYENVIFEFTNGTVIT